MDAESEIRAAWDRAGHLWRRGEHFHVPVKPRRPIAFDAAPAAAEARFVAFRREVVLVGEVPVRSIVGHLDGVTAVVAVEPRPLGAGS